MALPVPSTNMFSKDNAKGKQAYTPPESCCSDEANGGLYKWLFVVTRQTNTIDKKYAIIYWKAITDGGRRMDITPLQKKTWRRWFAIEVIARKGFPFIFRLSLLFLFSLIALVFYMDSLNSESIIAIGLPAVFLIYGIFLFLTWNYMKHLAKTSMKNREKLGLTEKEYKKLIDFRE